MQQEISEQERYSVMVGDVEIRYYVRESSPDKWNAIGVIYLAGHDRPHRDRCPLLVGTGETYYEAIGDMMARALGGAHPDLQRYIEGTRVQDVAQPEDLVGAVADSTLNQIETPR